MAEAVAVVRAKRAAEAHGEVAESQFPRSMSLLEEKFDAYEQANLMIFRSKSDGTLSSTHDSSPLDVPEGSIAPENAELLTRGARTSLRLPDSATGREDPADDDAEAERTWGGGAGGGDGGEGNASRREGSGNEQAGPSSSGSSTEDERGLGAVSRACLPKSARGSCLRLGRREQQRGEGEHTGGTGKGSSRDTQRSGAGDSGRNGHAEGGGDALADVHAGGAAGRSVGRGGAEEGVGAPLIRSLTEDFGRRGVVGGCPRMESGVLHDAEMDEMDGEVLQGVPASAGAPAACAEALPGPGELRAAHARVILSSRHPPALPLVRGRGVHTRAGAAEASAALPRPGGLRAAHGPPISCPPTPTLPYPPLPPYPPTPLSSSPPFPTLPLPPLPSLLPPYPTPSSLPIPLSPSLPAPLPTLPFSPYLTLPLPPNPAACLISSPTPTPGMSQDATNTFAGTDDFYQWLNNSIIQTLWADFTCGDGTCNRPFQYPAFGRFGCQADCGTFPNLTSVVVHLSSQLHTQQAAEQSSWNLCMVNPVSLCCTVELASWGYCAHGKDGAETDGSAAVAAGGQAGEGGSAGAVTGNDICRDTCVRLATCLPEACGRTFTEREVAGAFVDCARMCIVAPAAIAPYESTSCPIVRVNRPVR
ncbi:unnamed protein product [Closterium sp. Naga37s-1]|nr:unnamed protein product [Closterium sp. Naga37s-1]